jgi:hypothetical protein
VSLRLRGPPSTHCNPRAWADDGFHNEPPPVDAVVVVVVDVEVDAQSGEDGAFETGAGVGVHAAIASAPTTAAARIPRILNITISPA